MKQSNDAARTKAIKARNWVASSTGKSALRDAIKLALTASINMKREGRANDKKLKEPITL